MAIEELLQRKFVEFSGNQFQKLFFEIMRNKYGDCFEMPEHYGNVGDYKCDGILKKQGEYFACYAPENPHDETVAGPMNAKLESDLNGLKAKIDDGTWKITFNRFVFVVNMKYLNSVPAPVVKKAQELESDLLKKYKRKIDVVLWTQYDLKKLFLSLDSKAQQFILNKAYLHEEDMDFHGPIVASIIEHFSNAPYRKIGIHNIMKFKNKLIFNNLSEERCADLECASYSISALEIYLQELSSDSLSSLQSMIVQLYEESKNEFPKDANLQFDFIKEKMYKMNGNESSHDIKNINDTILIVMSKFFENCSIFESEECE